MLHVNNNLHLQIATRMLEFFYRDVPWNRALWSPGLRIQLLEVLESSEAVQAGALHTAALQHFCGLVLPLAVNDQGVGDSRAKAVIDAALKGRLLYHSADYYSLEMLARDLGIHYLARWAQHLRDTPAPSVERAARSIAAHLLDLGFDSDFLHQWWTYRITHEAGSRTLADLVDEAHAMSQEAPRRWDALVAFEALPTRGGVPNGWLDSPRVHAWLRANNFPVEGVRQNGGIELSVTARDPYAAVAVIRERLDAISARVALTITGRLRVVNKVWIRGQDEPFDLFRLRHRAEIHSLRKEHQLYSVADENSLLDSAIALMQPVNGGNLSAAISGAWGAVETLLFSPGDGDRVTAGDRMATIVACSFPRAELTAIAHNIDAATPLGARVAGINENKAKAREIALFIQNNPNDPITLTRTIDEASLSRIKKIAASPSNGLRDLQGHLSSAFRRLYRSRNLILHWGRVGVFPTSRFARLTKSLLNGSLPHALVAIPFRNPIQITGGGRDGYTSKSISAQWRICY